MSAGLKTLQIGDEWVGERPGGLARYYAELVRALPAAGCEVRGLVVGSELAGLETQGRIQSFSNPQDPLPQRLRALRKAALPLLAEQPTDVLVAHFALYALPLLHRPGNVPLVVHFHGPWAEESGVEGARTLNTRLKRLVERAVYSRAGKLIVLSKAFQDELINRYGVAPDNVRCVPGGVDTDHFHMQLSRTEARERLGWPDDRPVLLTVRRLVRRMGLEALVDAARLVIATQPDALFLLAGTGPQAEALQARITEYGLGRNFQLLGRLSDADLPVAYRAADLSVVPSESFEGFGLITLESLASGTPAFVTPVGGLPEVIRPFASECVFESTSAESMAQRLTEVLRGVVPRPTDLLCRQYASTHFSWNTIAARVRAVYAEAVR